MYLYVCTFYQNEILLYRPFCRFCFRQLDSSYHFRKFSCKIIFRAVFKFFPNWPENVPLQLICPNQHLLCIVFFWLLKVWKDNILTVEYLGNVKQYKESGHALGCQGPSCFKCLAQSSAQYMCILSNNRRNISLIITLQGGNCKHFGLHSVFFLFYGYMSIIHTHTWMYLNEQVCT